MISRLRERADQRWRLYFPERAAALIEACSHAWAEIDTDRHTPAVQAFTESLPLNGWSIQTLGVTPTLVHEDLSELPAPALAALEALKPWRKGPYGVLDTTIDAEWRSDLKWERVAPLLPDLAGKVVVDIGSNNGYYAHRMAEADVAAVFCVEPTSLYVAQALCFEALVETSPSTTVPVGLDILGLMKRDVDVMLLMGILYHHTDPLHVLRLCAQALRAGGTLIVETIIIEGEGSTALFVPGKYTGAKGFYWLPTLECLQTWVRRAGLRIVETLDAVATTRDEQRVTVWRGGEASLPEGLDPNAPSKTIEGHPAPQRIALKCTLA